MYSYAIAKKQKPKQSKLNNQTNSIQSECEMDKNKTGLKSSLYLFFQKNSEYYFTIPINCFKLEQSLNQKRSNFFKPTPTQKQTNEDLQIEN